MIFSSCSRIFTGQKSLSDHLVCFLGLWCHYFRQLVVRCWQGNYSRFSQLVSLWSLRYYFFFSTPYHTAFHLRHIKKVRVQIRPSNSEVVEECVASSISRQDLRQVIVYITVPFTTPESQAGGQILGPFGRSALLFLEVFSFYRGSAS